MSLKTEGHSKLKVTQNGMSLEIKFPVLWNDIKMEFLSKRIYRLNFDLVVLQTQDIQFHLSLKYWF